MSALGKLTLVCGPIVIGLELIITSNIISFLVKVVYLSTAFFLDISLVIGLGSKFAKAIANSSTLLCGEVSGLANCVVSDRFFDTTS
jgi:hypothetical protein